MSGNRMPGKNVSWPEECSATFIRDGVVNVYSGQELEPLGLNVARCRMKKDFSSCNRHFLFEKMKYLKQHVEPDTLLFHGTHMKKVPHERYHSYYIYQFTCLVALPRKDLYIIVKVQKKFRQVQRFMRRMCDATKVETLLYLKKFVLAEDVDFDVSM